MSALIRLAGEVLPKILESEKGRKATLAGLRKAKEGLGSLGSFAGRATEGAVRSGAPAAAEFAGKFASGRGPIRACLLYTSPSPRDRTRSRMPSSA